MPVQTVGVVTQLSRRSFQWSFQLDGPLPPPLVPESCFLVDYSPRRRRSYCLSPIHSPHATSPPASTVNAQESPPFRRDGCTFFLRAESSSNSLHFSLQACSKRPPSVECSLVVSGVPGIAPCTLTLASGAESLEFSPHLGPRNGLREGAAAAVLTLTFAPRRVALNNTLTLPARDTLGLGRFFNATQLADCSVGTEDGRRFPAHKLVLSAASPALAALLDSELAEGVSGHVAIKEAEPAVVELLLRAMYGLEVAVPLAQSIALFKLADQWQAEALVAALREELLDVEVGVEALCELLPLALSLGPAAVGIRAHLVAQAARQLPAMAKQPRFSTWHVLAVERLLQQLPAGCTYSALLACAAWACAPCTGDTSSGSGSSAEGSGDSSSGAKDSSTSSDANATSDGGSIRSERSQEWLRLQELLQLGSTSLSLEQLRELQGDVPALLQLPGLAAALLGRLLA